MTDIRVKLGRRCECGADTLAVVGDLSGAAPLFCPHCNRSCGLLSRDIVKFIAKVIVQFGQPSDPVIVRQSPYRAGSANENEARAGANESV